MSQHATQTQTQQQQQPKKKLDAQCRSCAQTVQEILQNPNSRPRQVLQSLINGMTNNRHEAASFTLKPVEDGVQVEMTVPDRPTQAPQRWTRIAPNNNSPSPTLNAPLTTPVLATSSSSSLSAHSQHSKSTTETIHIECRPCDSQGPEQGARALIMGPTPLSIVACTNRLDVNDKHEMAQILTHELLHAYDVRALNLNFADCESMAYSEVRAAREAECHGRSFLKEYCVKQKAIAATHNLFPSQGRNCVGAVFSTAYHDARPFAASDLKTYVTTNNANRSPSTTKRTVEETHSRR